MHIWNKKNQTGTSVFSLSISFCKIYISTFFFIFLAQWLRRSSSVLPPVKQAGNLRPHKKLTQIRLSPKPERRGINIDDEKHNKKSHERMLSLCCRVVRTDVAQLEIMLQSGVGWGEVFSFTVLAQCPEGRLLYPD